MVFFTGIGGHRGRGCTDHDFYQPLRNIPHLPVENSLASIEAAFKAGADYVEIDAVMSGDDVLFTLHNVVPKDHFFGERKPTDLLHKMKFSDIQRFKTGRFENGELSDLVTVLNTIAAHDPKTLPWGVNIEIKGVQGSGQPYETNDYLQRLSTSVHASKYPAERILFSSFSLQNVLRMTHLLPQAQYGMLFAERAEPRAVYADHQDDMRYQYLPFNSVFSQNVFDTWKQEAAAGVVLKYLHPETQTINAEMISLAKKQGLGINCWGLFEHITEERAELYRALLGQCRAADISMTIITDYIENIQAL